MTDFVRVADPGTGYGLSVPASVAEADGLTPLKEEAVDRNGSPLPASYPGQPDVSGAGEPRESWHVEDLRDWASAHGVVTDGTKKADVFAAIQKARQPAEPTEATKEAQK